MKSSRFFCRVLALVGICLAAVLASVARGQEPSKPKVVWKKSAGVLLTKARESYWIGISCAPISPVLKSQLKLDSGVAVRSVVHGSPAQKAGIEAHDILLQFDGNAVKSAEDLGAAVVKVGDKSVEVKLLRKGELKSVEVRPTSAKIWDPQPGKNASLALALQQPEAIKRPLLFQFVKPGIVLSDKILIEKLPAGTSVSITKQGGEPARIVVKRGEDKWQVTEDKVKELPEDVRKHVQALLGKTTHQLSVDWTKLPKLHDPIPNSGRNQTQPSVDLKGRLNWTVGERHDHSDLGRQLKKMQQQLGELQEQLKKLQDSK